MSVEGVCTSYVGQLFHGEAKSKSWSPLIAGQVAVHLRMREGGDWWIVASKKDKTWEKCLNSTLKYRIKDSFIQWQYHGEMETFGLRVKSEVIAKQFGEAIDMILKSPALTGKRSSPPPTKRPSKAPIAPPQDPPTSKQASPPPAKQKSKAAPPQGPPPPQNPPNTSSVKEEDGNVVLKVEILGKDEVGIKVPKSVLLQRIFKSVCQRKELDHTLHTLALPPDSAHGEPLPCQPGLSVGDLKSYKVLLMRKEEAKPPVAKAAVSKQESKQESRKESSKKESSKKESRQESSKKESKQESKHETTNNDEQLMLLQVELPFSQTTVVRVAPSILMGELLCYICGKRNMNPAHHRFDLPVTEESLAQRSLQQLRISAIKVIRKDSAPPQDAASLQTDTPLTVDTPPSPMKSKHKKKASKKKHLADSDQGEGLGERKNTLPPQPPQKRKTQPELLRELEKEMAGRRNKEGIVGVVEGKDTPPLTRANGEGGAGDKATPLTRDPEEEQGTGSDVIAPPKEVGVAKVTDSPQRSRGSLLRPRTQPPPTPPSSKATPTSSNPESDVAVGKVPPPISSKPDRRGTDESEFATPTDDGRGHVAPPTNSDTGVVAVGKERVKGSTTSLRRKPKGPAPAPPPARANTLARTRNLTSMVTLSSTSKESEDSGDVMLAKTRRKTETSLPSYSTSVPEGGGRDVIDQTPLARSHSPMGAGGAMGRSRPSRRAPSRPPPSKPDVGSVKEEESVKEDRMKEDKGSVKEEESVKEDSVKEGSVEGDSVEEGEKVAILEGALKEEAKVSEAKVSETTNSLNSEPRPPHAPPSTLPLDRSPPKQDHQSSPAKETATTICQSSEDGGKVLIVKPSPGSTRRALGTSPIIFKLPPPPPNPPSPDKATPTPKRPVSKEGVSLGSDKPPVSEKPKKTPPKTLPTTSPKTTPTTPPKTPPTTPPKTPPTTSPKTPPTTSPKIPPTTSPKTPPIPPKTPPKTPPIPPKTPPKTPPIPPKTPPKTPPTTSPKNSPPKLSPRTSLKSRPKESRGAIQTPSRKPQTSESVLEMSSTPSSLGGHQGVSPGGDLLNATIVSNEFTNFDELSLEDIVTTDFSIEENLEPPKGERDLFHSGIGRRLDSAGMSNTSMSDSECSMGSRDGGFHIQSDDDEALVRKSPRVKHEKTAPTKLSSNHSSPSRSPGRRRPVPPPPSVQGTEVAMSSVLFLNSNNNNNNNSNNNIDSGSDAHSEDEPTGKTKGEWHVYTPRGDVGVATPDDDDMPMEPPSSGEDDSDTSSSSEHSLDDGDADLGSGEIVLISMRQQPLEGVASSLSSHDQERVADIASGSGPVEEGWVEKTESEVQSVSEKREGQGNGEEKGEGQGEGYRMGDVTLNELDNVVSDLRELVEQSSNQEPQDYSPPSSVSPTTPSSPPPPPPPPSNLPPPPSPPPPTSDLPPPPPPSPPPSSSSSTSSSSSSSSPPTPPLSLNIEDRDVPTLPVSPPPPLTDTHSDEDNVTKESQLNRRIKSRFSKPTPPPLPTAKPRGLFRKKSKPVIDAENADSAKDELFEKMKERQAKLREQAAEPSGEAKSEPGSNSSQQESVSSSNSSQHGSVSGSDSSQQKDSASNSGSNSGGDNVQMQLQFLQQQVIQQQMMQLQQQFQQLLAMNPGINLPGMGMGIQGMGTGVPNMAGAGMGVPNIAGMSAPNMAGAGMSVPSMAGAGMGVPNMTGAGMGVPNMTGPGMGVAGAGMGVPNMAGAGMGAQGAGMGMGGMGMGVPAMNPSMMNAQMLGMNALNTASLQTMSPQMMPQFQQQAMSGMQVGMGMAPQVGVASQVGVAPQVGVAQNLQQQQVSTSSGHVHQDAGESQDTSDDTPTMRKKSECMIERSGVMGNMEGRFDQLMDDIRDTNPHNILKRTPLLEQQSEEVDSDPDSSSYTGMVSALAMAIKERRQHISDKRQSLGDESVAEEWQSP